MPNDGTIQFVEGYQPGILASIVSLHMAYYTRDWNFGQAFETKVAGELAAFLERFEPDTDLFLHALDGSGRLLGSVTIDGCDGFTEQGAHLRWFIVSDGARGTGVGRQLLRSALEFCDTRDFAKVYLTTFAGLEAARHLYEAHGFQLVDETEIDQWQGNVREQRFERVRTAD